MTTTREATIADLPMMEETAKLLQKLRIDFPPAKGLMFNYQLQSATPFLVFEKDLEIYTKSWGSQGQGPYQKVKPFADPQFMS